MSLQLDERQRAMLEAMGIRMFEPLHAAPAAEAPAVAAPAPQGRSAPRVVPPAPAAPASRPVQPSTVMRNAGCPEVDPMGWDELAQAVAACQACPLHAGRHQALLGSGDLHPQWMIVGDPPGEQEDMQGEPFAGQSGKLLDNMLKALGLDRGKQVYLSNVLKCRPPLDRNPEPQELAQCEPFLRRQVHLLQPGVILAMGRFAAQALLGTTEPIGKLRGRAHQVLGVPVVVTFHPLYLLRNPAEKAKAWADLCLAQQQLR